jgi:hypothetical protein
MRMQTTEDFANSHVMITIHSTLIDTRYVGQMNTQSTKCTSSTKYMPSKDQRHRMARLDDGN